MIIIILMTIIMIIIIGQRVVGESVVRVGSDMTKYLISSTCLDFRVVGGRLSSDIKVEILI